MIALIAELDEIAGVGDGGFEGEVVVVFVDEGELVGEGEGVGSGVGFGGGCGCGGGGGIVLEWGLGGGVPGGVKGGWGGGGGEKGGGLTAGPLFFRDFDPMYEFEH